MSKLRALVADDELMARRRMRRLLSAMPDLEIVAECASGEEALAELDRVEVDVAFLDVRMAGLSGLDVSEVAVELGVEVVLTTAHPEHAVAAFEHGALDYVLKPVEAERLAAAITRVRRRLDTDRVSSANAAGAARRPRPRSTRARGPRRGAAGLSGRHFPRRPRRSAGDRVGRSGEPTHRAFAQRARAQASRRLVRTRSPARITQPTTSGSAQAAPDRRISRADHRRARSAGVEASGARAETPARHRLSRPLDTDRDHSRPRRDRSRKGRGIPAESSGK